MLPILVVVLPADREALLELERGGAAASHPDTVWFGGSGTGDASVVRGGTWTWEADSGEAPEFEVVGPVRPPVAGAGLRRGKKPRLSAAPGAGDRGAFAHRAATHANDGVDDGPDPLVGAWSVWIGSNLPFRASIPGHARISASPVPGAGGSA